MDTIKNEILKLYIEKIIEQTGYEKVGSFINSHLEEDDRYITLEQYVSLFSENGERVVECEHDYPRKFCLTPDTKILPLSLNVQDKYRELNYGENYIKSTDIINPQAIGMPYKNWVPSIFAFVLTENNDVVLLKCHIYPKKLVYFTLNLISLFKVDESTKTIEERPFDKENFMITLLPEFLFNLTYEQKRYESYAIRDILFENAIRHIIQYNIGKRDDLYYIREGLRSSNPGYKEITVLQKNKKKELIISVDGTEIKARYLNGEIKPIKSKMADKTYRTKNGIQIKEDLDFIIIKAKEPGSSQKHHYVFVSNIEKAVDNYAAITKRSENRKEERLPVSALFKKDENGNFILEKDINDRSYSLEYDDIFDVDLSVALKGKI